MILRTPTSPLFPYTTLFRSFDVGPIWLRCFERRDDLGRGLRELRHLSRHLLILPEWRDVAAARELATESLRSEEHTSELQSRRDLVCRLLLEKKKTISTALSSLPSIGLKLHLRWK